MRRALILLVVLASTTCGGGREERLNVQPPAPGVPATPSDVSGIYRSIHQGLLQLRANGSFTLIVPAEPKTTTGTFTLDNGRMEVRTDKCDGAIGRYRVVVTGEHEPGKAKLEFSADPGDPCAHRQRYLTIDPWVYANS